MISGFCEYYQWFCVPFLLIHLYHTEIQPLPLRFEKKIAKKFYLFDILKLTKDKKLNVQPKNTQILQPFHQDLCFRGFIELLPVTRCSQENITVHILVCII